MVMTSVACFPPTLLSKQISQKGAVGAVGGAPKGRGRGKVPFKLASVLKVKN